MFLWLNQIHFSRLDDQRNGAGHFKFAVEAFPVPQDGFRTQLQGGRNVLGRLSLRELLQDVPLAAGQGDGVWRNVLFHNGVVSLQQELYRPEYWCEIMPASASKANAIRKLKEMWGCSRVVSFGDAVNDLPMFDMSDECYAVSNAVEELKAAATGIIGSNEEDGVAVWLLRHAVLPEGGKDYAVPQEK